MKTSLLYFSRLVLYFFVFCRITLGIAQSTGQCTLGDSFEVGSRTTAGPGPCPAGYEYRLTCFSPACTESCHCIDNGHGAGNGGDNGGENAEGSTNTSGNQGADTNSSASSSASSTSSTGGVIEDVNNCLVVPSGMSEEEFTRRLNLIYGELGASLMPAYHPDDIRPAISNHHVSSYEMTVAKDVRTISNYNYDAALSIVEYNNLAKSAHDQEVQLPEVCLKQNYHYYASMAQSHQTLIDGLERKKLDAEHQQEMLNAVGNAQNFEDQNREALMDYANEQMLETTTRVVAALDSLQAAILELAEAKRRELEICNGIIGTGIGGQYDSICEDPYNPACANPESDNPDCETARRARIAAELKLAERANNVVILIGKTLTEETKSLFFHLIDTMFSPLTPYYQLSESAFPEDYREKFCFPSVSGEEENKCNKAHSLLTNSLSLEMKRAIESDSLYDPQVFSGIGSIDEDMAKHVKTVSGSANGGHQWSNAFNDNEEGSLFCEVKPDATIDENGKCRGVTNITGKLDGDVDKGLGDLLFGGSDHSYEFTLGLDGDNQMTAEGSGKEGIRNKFLDSYLKTTAKYTRMEALVNSCAILDGDSTDEAKANCQEKLDQEHKILEQKVSAINAMIAYEHCRLNYYLQKMEQIEKLAGEESSGSISCKEHQANTAKSCPMGKTATPLLVPATSTSSASYRCPSAYTYNQESKNCDCDAKEESISPLITENKKTCEAGSTASTQHDPATNGETCPEGYVKIPNPCFTNGQGCFSPAPSYICQCSNTTSSNSTAGDSSQGSTQAQAKWVRVEGQWTTCENGKQYPVYLCTDSKTGETLSPENLLCVATKPPEASNPRDCSSTDNPPKITWQPQDTWSECNRDCKQSRAYFCLNADTGERIWEEEICTAITPRPEEVRSCNGQACTSAPAKWVALNSWGSCQQGCNKYMNFACVINGSPVSDDQCQDPRPVRIEICKPSDANYYTFCAEVDNLDLDWRTKDVNVGQLFGCQGCGGNGAQLPPNTPCWKYDEIPEFKCDNGTEATMWTQSLCPTAGTCPPGLIATRSGSLDNLTPGSCLDPVKYGTDVWTFKYGCSKSQ